MGQQAISYVVRANGSWRIADSRVSLDSIVHAYLDGQSPEGIADSFPSLSLEQVHGAIAFYLRHRKEVDRHLASQEARWERFRKSSESKNEPLLNRIRQRRRSLLAGKSKS